MLKHWGQYSFKALQSGSFTVFSIEIGVCFPPVACEVKCACYNTATLHAKWNFTHHLAPVHLITNSPWLTLHFPSRDVTKLHSGFIVCSTVCISDVCWQETLLTSIVTVYTVWLRYCKHTSNYSELHCCTGADVWALQARQQAGSSVW